MGVGRTISLDQLTVIGVSHAELVEVAAAAGFDAIGPINAVRAYEGVPAAHLKAGSPEVRDLRRALDGAGLFINNVDGFALTPDAPLAEMRASLELMAELGARRAVALVFDPDASRAFDNFCRLDAWAQAAGMGLVLEFTPLSQVPGLADAVAYVQRVGSDNVGLLVDILHLMQSGGSPADLAGVPPGLIRGAQLCDGPAAPSFEAYAHAAIYDRGLPGEGELPVEAFVKALPADVVLGVEAPRQAIVGREISPREWAARAMRATRAVITRAGLA